MTRVETLAIVYQAPRLLLAQKKRGLGKGKINGFGGGLEPKETLKECVVRETLEEAGINLINPIRYGIIRFDFESDEQRHIVHFFRASEFIGVPRETLEMKPIWVHQDNIPYNQMWADDEYWLPFLLQGKKFAGRFRFNSDYEITKLRLKTLR